MQIFSSPPLSSISNKQQWVDTALLMLPQLDKTVSWLKLVREKKLVEQTREHSRILPISSIYLKASFTSSFAQCLLTKGRQAVLPACCHKHTFHNENLANTFLRSSFKESYHFCSCLARMCSVTHCEFVKGLIDWLIWKVLYKEPGLSPLHLVS